VSRREAERVLALDAVAEAARGVIRSADALKGTAWDEGRAAFFRASADRDPRRQGRCTVRALVAVAALALIGCRPSTSPKVYLDADFTAAEVEALIAGSEEWSTHAELGLDFHVFLASHDEVSREPLWQLDTILVVRMRGSDCPFGDPPQGWATAEHGGALGLTKNVAVSTSRGVCLNATEVERRGLSLADGLAHELGHAYGLGHVTDRASVMTPSESVGVQPSDVAAIREELGE
jgi:hypothetical protein